MNQFTYIFFFLIGGICLSCDLDTTTQMASGQGRSATPDQIAFPSLAGHYVMRYALERGWDYQQINREESIHIREDSTYYWELLRPQGTFEVRPEAGRLRFSQDTVYLESGRGFVFRGGQLFSISNPDRPELNEVPWFREG